MNAGKNRRMTNCGGRSSGALAFSPRFQRIFERRRAVSPLDSPLLQEFLSLSAVLAKAPEFFSQAAPEMHRERGSSSHDEALRRNYKSPGVDREIRRRARLSSWPLSSCPAAKRERNFPNCTRTVCARVEVADGAGRAEDTPDHRKIKDEQSLRGIQLRN